MGKRTRRVRKSLASVASVIATTHRESDSVFTRNPHRKRSLTGISVPLRLGPHGRHRDKAAPKAGEIQQKRSDALNKNLPNPIPGFRGNTSVGVMREKTGATSLEGIRRAAKKQER